MNMYSSASELIINLAPKHDKLNFYHETKSYNILNFYLNNQILADTTYSKQYFL